MTREEEEEQQQEKEQDEIISKLSCNSSNLLLKLRYETRYLEYSHTDDDINRDRHVGGSVPLSSNNCSMKRLESEAIVNLQIGDDIKIIVPPINRKEPAAAKDTRESTLNLFKCISREGCNNVPTTKKSEF